MRLRTVVTAATIAFAAYRAVRGARRSMRARVKAAVPAKKRRALRTLVS